jgi:dihydroorotase-like cyclic amidohydrolase
MKEEKGKFRFVPNGIPGVETRLPLLYTGGLQTGRISPQRFVDVTSTNPAKLVSAAICSTIGPNSPSMGCTPGKAPSCPAQTPTSPSYVLPGA